MPPTPLGALVGHAPWRRAITLLEQAGIASVAGNYDRCDERPRKDCCAGAIRRYQAFWFLLAAAGELAGCYAFWGWLRLGRPVWWILWGIASLVVFAWALARVDSTFAGRTFAAYGGVYVLGALVWLVIVEQARPDRWDLLGVGLCVAGTLVILFGPR